MDILFAMTAADLPPDALAKLEAKLMADLDMVRKVRALLEEHQLGSGGMAAAPAAASVVVSVPKAVFKLAGRAGQFVKMKRHRRLGQER